MSRWSKSLYLQVFSGQDLQKQNLPPPSQLSGKLIYHMVQELVRTRIGDLLLMTLPLVFFVQRPVHPRIGHLLLIENLN